MLRSFLPVCQHRPLEPNSSTTPNVRIPNIAVSYTAPCPSYAKKVSQAYIEVYSPSYVHCLCVHSPQSDLVLDDATRCQFGCSLHDLYHPQAVCSVHRTARTTASDWHYVCYWCYCGPRDCIRHPTTRVGLLSSCSNTCLTYKIVSSRRACSLLMPPKSIKTRSIVLTGS